MNKDKELEEAIEKLKDFKSIKILYGNTFAMHIAQLKDIQKAIETVLQALQKSTPKDIIRQKINERQFELQQEYKDFKDDIRLNTLQELYYYKED